MSVVSHPFSLLCQPSAVCLLLLTSYAHAADSRSSLTLEIGFDEQGNQSQTLYADSTLPHKRQLSLAASQQKNSNSNAKQYAINLGSDPYAPLHLSIGYDHWQSGAGFEINSQNLVIGLNIAQWYIALSPIQREIEIEVLARPGARRKISLSATGFTRSLRYFTASGWQMGFRYTEYRYTEYRYTEKLSRLDPVRSPRVVRLFTPHVLSQALGLDSRNGYFDLGFPFKTLYVVLTLGQSQSAVDGRRTHIALIDHYIPLTDEWEVGIGFGQQRFAAEAITFSNLALTYEW
ncbi:MAG: hypothetical protein L3J62_01250 [Gammaproteobacteria bacterium]|nr:hypothetical protein [Gammaproteobacteria bacterium]MCF6229411.1 hypothetical protein [Gammaproteobacteria bacterium]